MYKNVLVIDDSYFDRLIAEKVIRLGAFAVNVILADSADSGLKYLNSVSGDAEAIPEIIFLDIRMPRVDGFGFLEQFEHLPKQLRDRCAIYMLSSSVDPGDVKKAGASRYVLGFISKPLTKEKLDSLNR